MAKSLASILSQIERLQKEADAIQSDVVARIRKDIEKYGLTAEQLFGAGAAPRRGRVKGMRPAGAAKPAKTTRPPKYADGAGNTWGGMGKRPDWVHQALAAGRSLEEFLIQAVTGNAVAKETPRPTKSAAPATRPASKSKGSAPKAKAAPIKKTPAKRKSSKSAAAPTAD